MDQMHCSSNLSVASSLNLHQGQLWTVSTSLLISDIALIVTFAAIVDDSNSNALTGQFAALHLVHCSCGVIQQEFNFA